MARVGAHLSHTRASLRQRWHDASLKGAFVGYVVIYLVPGVVIALVFSLALSWFGDLVSDDSQGIMGLYLFDSSTDELVPADEIVVGNTPLVLFVESGGPSAERIPLADFPEAAHIEDINLYGIFDMIETAEAADHPGSNATEGVAGSGSDSGAGSATTEAADASAAGEQAESADGTEVVGALTALDGIDGIEWVRSLSASDGQDEAADMSDPFVQLYLDLADLGPELNAASLATYDELGREAVQAWASEHADNAYAQLLENGGAVQDLMVSPMGYYVYLPVAPADATLVTLCRILSIAVWPLWIGVFLVLASRRFYGTRIRPALELLDVASTKIAERDLDFTVYYDRHDEMGRLIDSFEVMRASLAASQRELMRTAEERRRLNAAFAHDLRTPLTVLKGKVELMAERLGVGDGGETVPGGPSAGARVPTPEGEDPSAGRGAGTAPVTPATALALRRDVVSLKGQVERLERYVAAMSSLRKLEEREVVRVPVELATLAHNVAEEGAGLCRSAGVAFEMEGAAGRAGFEGPAGSEGAAGSAGSEGAAGSAGSAGAGSADPAGASVSVDRALVLEVADNLLANAARYARGRVTARLGVEEHADGGTDRSVRAPRVLVLVVTDDGPGFSPEARQRGCEAFFGEARGGDHLGLGLNIARALCERHDGALELGDAPGGGARVTARFGIG